MTKRIQSSRKKKVKTANGRHGAAATAAQNSEYRDLLERVNARRDAKQILKTVKMIAKNL